MLSMFRKKRLSRGKLVVKFEEMTKDKSVENRNDEKCEEKKKEVNGLIESKREALTELNKGKGCEKIDMEVGVVYTQGTRVGASPDRTRSPRGNLHVEFEQVGEMKERKEKYLTAKYGAHQMSLIRKRLGVEMWMFDQLQQLYPPQEGKTEEKEVDLDELLDVEELKRKNYLKERLSDCKDSKEKVEKFITDLLERAKTL